MSDSKPVNLTKSKHSINPDELRRKIMKEAKRIFVASKGETIPTKKEITQTLNAEEIAFLKDNIDKVFSTNIPERQFWEAYAPGSKIEKRKEILSKMVAEDNFLKTEKRLLDQNQILPTKQEVLKELSPEDRSIILESRNPIYSTTQALDSLANRDRRYFLENGVLYTNKLVDTEQQELYLDYIDSQKDNFVIYINFINNLLCELKKYRIVHDSTKLSARIKSSDSAVSNDYEKALDDVFGVEIDFSTEMEKTVIEKIIKSTITITKEKRHNKANGYKAYHCCGFPCDLDKDFNDTALANTLIELFPHAPFLNNLIKNTKKIMQEYEGELLNSLMKNPDLSSEEFSMKEAASLVPIVEFQFKTIHVAIEAINGTSSHWEYKDDVKQDEKIKIIAEIQKKYTDMIKIFGKIPLSHVATMWESTIDGKPPRQLSSMEVLKHVYPFFIDPKDLEETQSDLDENDPREN